MTPKGHAWELRREFDLRLGNCPVLRVHVEFMLAGSVLFSCAGWLVSLSVKGTPAMVLTVWVVQLLRPLSSPLLRPLVAGA